MEVIERYGSPEQKEKWLKPLLEGKIRSAYIMTEPGVASSDATNLALDAKLEGDEWVLNGEKWFASGAGDPRCKIYIVMVCTDPTRREAQATLPDLRAGRHQGRGDPAPHEGVRRRRCAARPHAHPLHERARAQGEPDPWPRPRLRGVAGPARVRAASTTACAPSASPSGRWSCCASARCRARRSASRWPSSAPTTTSSPRAA